MESFIFEHIHKFTEKEHVDLMRVFAKKTRLKRILIGLFIGIACLFWSYTLTVGLIIILIIVLIPVLVRTLPGTAANNYKKIAVLRAENLYGANEKELWLRNSNATVKISWKLVSVWDEQEGWLRISSSTFPTFWFPIHELKKIGVYQNFINLCRANAVKFNSKEAKESLAA